MADTMESNPGKTGEYDAQGQGGAGLCGPGNLRDCDRREPVVQPWAI